MIKQEDAKAILALGAEQLFPIEGIAQAVNVASTTIRNWINRGHLELLQTRLFGKGSKALFAYYDVIQIVAMAELSHLGIDPKQSGRLVVHIQSLISHQIRSYAGEWGDPTNYVDFKRYAYIFYNYELDKLEIAVVTEDIDREYPTVQDISIIALDCLELAKKSVYILLNMKR